MTIVDATSRLALALALAAGMAGCNDIRSAVNYPDAEVPVQIADCDGTRSNWDFCYEAAARFCPQGYQIIDRKESSDSPSLAFRTEVKRSISFRCK